MKYLFSALLLILMAWCIMYYVLWKKNKRLLNLAIKSREAEIKLLNKQSNDDRDDLLDAFGYAFLLVNSDNQIVFSNTAAKKLFKGRQLNERKILETFLNDQLVQIVTECIEKRQAQSQQIIIRNNESSLSNEKNQDGLSAWMVDVAPHTSSDKTDYTCVIFRNMTAEYQADQIRQDFVANASHELRTPMAIIKGYLEALLEDNMIEEPDIAKRFLTIMDKHSNRISRIIDDMLAISKLESKEEASINMEEFKINECIVDVVERLSPLISENKANVNVYIKPKNLSFNGDKFYWAQIMFNLVENALKENPKPGIKVDISAYCIDNDIIIKVTDYGKGIPVEALPYIFKRFYRVDKHHTNSGIKGTGLGLSIVKRAVEGHGGTISVHSIPGVETVFTIKIPN